MTADELMNAQNDARRTAYARQQLGSGWAGNPADLEIGATVEANRCVPGSPPSGEYLGAMRNVARQSFAPLGAIKSLAQQARAPGKMFTREEIVAIIRAAIARQAHRGEDASELHDLRRTFENLE